MKAPASERIGKIYLKLLMLSCPLLIPVIASAQEPADTAGIEDDLSGPYLGQPAPGTEPRLFAPGIIPVDGFQHCFPAFSPDGREVFWMHVFFENDKPRGEIRFMKEIDGRWVGPDVAPFSGEFNDHAPVFSGDGTRLYFASSRPGATGPGKNLWYVERANNGWGEPRPLGSPPNTELGATQPTFTRDGTVYFVGRCDSAQWNSGIYRSRLVNGQYQEPELLGPPIWTPEANTYPYIAPDESFLIFGSSRPGARSTETDLYISFRDSNDVWSEPVQMDKLINNGMSVSFSFVTHDGKFLFFDRFDSDGTDKFYWVDASVIDQYRGR